jgi:hypothetical protein
MSARPCPDSQYLINVNGATFSHDGYQGSDIQWKKNVEPISGALALVQPYRESGLIGILPRLPPKIFPATRLWAE